MTAVSATTVAIAASVAATAGSLYSSYQAGQAQEEAAEERSAQARRQKIRETRQQLRENRMRRAAVANQSAQTGVADSSLELGTQGRLQSQLGGNLGTLETEFGSQQRMLRANQRAAELNTQASLFQGVAGTASMFAPGGGASDLFSSGGASPSPTLPNNPGPRQTPWGGR